MRDPEAAAIPPHLPARDALKALPGRFGGRVAQRESTSLTSRGSQVQSLSRPPFLLSDIARDHAAFVGVLSARRQAIEAARLCVTIRPLPGP
uniref:Uncharacterized protein n=1 Tax=Caulobacter sp. (strain K31) TaxID=366602 RepID=B0SVF6_CAUSK